MQGSLDGLLTGNSGASRPAYATAGMSWLDTSVSGVISVYLYDGNDDILLTKIDVTTNRRADPGASFADVASATTTDIGTVISNFIRVTGTTTITGLGVAPAGAWRVVRMAASLTLTHNATSLILPGAANIATAANDCFLAVSLGSGNWIICFYQKAAGPGLVSSEILALFNAAGSAPVYACRAWVNFNGTGTVAIRGSGNVSSITDNGVGDYTINFTTALPNANYACVGLSSQKSGVEGQSFMCLEWTTVPSTTAVRVTTLSRSTGNAQDNAYNNVAIFG